MHTQTAGTSELRAGIASRLHAAAGLGLYLLTLAGEVVLGAGVRWFLTYLGAVVLGAFVPLGPGAEQLALLTADLDGTAERLVDQGEGVTLRGELRGTGGDIAGAPLCVFSQVEGDTERQFLGIAITGSRGDYRFAIGAGPNRTLRAVYRPGQRRLAAEARLRTQVKPTLRARKPVVHTGEAAHLEGEIPGPRNDEVVIVLQVKQGDGWLAFRRYRTRGGGRFEADYLFRRTIHPTIYEMRAQVRETSGYPYVEGDSDPVFLRVLPKRATARKACPAGKRRIKRRGKARCVRRQAGARKRCARAKQAKRRGESRCAPGQARHGRPGR